MSHDKFIAIDPEAYIEPPYLRIGPVLRYGVVDLAAARADEYVLLVMHCSDAQLLVISTKRILMYKIPVKTSFLQRLGSGVVSVTVSFVTDSIPLVSEASTIVGGIDAFGSIRDRIMRGKDMPLKKDAINTEWDLNDKNHCLGIICYTDKILLENGWYWKKTLEIPMKKVLKKGVEISIGSDGVSGKIGGKKVSIGFVADSKINYKEYARDLINHNGGAFTAAGWQAGFVEGSLVIKK